MSIFHHLKKAISSADMFYSSEMLRYDFDAQFKTLTGGIITIALVILVIMGFLNMIGDTVKKSTIHSQQSEIHHKDPTLFELINDKEHNFMFGLNIMPMDMSFNIDLNNGPRYFDIQMGIMQQSYQTMVDTKYVDLVACTDQHWQMMPDILKAGQLLDYKSWVCPKIGQILPIQGTQSSQSFLMTYMRVGPCINQTNPNRPCAPQEDIDALFDTYQNFYVTVNYINSVLSPSMTNYVTYYLEQMDYVIFSKTQGTQLVIELTDFTITTDNSLWPYSTYQEDRGVMAKNKGINHPFTVSNYTGYANLYFTKASNSLIITREVQKISAVFSYIGGLLGALTALLFILKFYTYKAFQFAIASQLFKENKHIDHQQSKKAQSEASSSNSEKTENQGTVHKFTILTYFKLVAYRVLSNFQCVQKWDTMKQLSEIQTEILCQLDVKMLLLRIIKLQNCISCLFDSYQIEGLRLHKGFDLCSTKKLRQQLLSQHQKLQHPQNSNSKDNIDAPHTNQAPQSQINKIDKSNAANFDSKNVISSASSLMKRQMFEPEPQNILSTFSTKKQSILLLQVLKNGLNQSNVNRRIWENIDKGLRQSVSSRGSPQLGQKRSRKKQKCIQLEPIECQKDKITIFAN